MEVAGSIVDVFDDLANLTEYPATLSFWRPQVDGLESDCLNWHSPIFDVCSHLNVMCDWLHTIDAGTGKYISGSIFGFIFRFNLYEHSGAQDAREKKFVSELQNQLDFWYADEKIPSKDQVFT